MSLTLIISLVLGGCFLLGIELFVPGGVLGVLGMIALVAGLAGVFAEYGPGIGIATVLAVAVVSIVAFRLWFAFFSKSRVGKKFMALTDTSDWVGYDAGLRDLVGQQGVTHTQLRPSGIVIIANRRYDVVTRGELIPAKAAVTVVEVQGNRIVVEAVASSTES